MKNIAIIPARGGSKGISKKNLKIIAGKQLVAHSITAAINSKTIEKTYVSTDDDEIARISKNYGASIILRPKKFSRDNDSSESALLHGLQFIEKNEGLIPQILVFLQCTSPLTTSEDIDNTMNTLINSGADTAFTATDFHYFLWGKNRVGSITGINHKKSERILRQNQNKQYLENGAIYIMKTNGFKKYKHRFFGKTAVYEMPGERSLEIDEPVDLYLAETLYRYNYNHLQLELLPNNITGIAFDFDGVFTNNKVLILENGYEGVICDRSDGMGIELLNSLNIPMIVISSEKNKVLSKRCNKLNIPFKHAVKNKIKFLADWINTNKVDRNGLIYVGNDINDIECLQYSACGICVADSHMNAKNNSDIVLSKSGGNGALRELSDLIRRKLKHD